MPECSKCKIEKPASEFWRKSNRPNGLQARCKPCSVETNKEWRQIMSLEFRPWPKTPRLFRSIVITEKIDGTNAAVVIRKSPEGSPFSGHVEYLAGYADEEVWFVGAQSRKRLLPMGPRGMDDRDWRKQDNAGFASWVRENAYALAMTLGEGYHYGEWWGHGINRGYGLEKGDRRFSLFNTSRWGHFDDPKQAPDIPGLGVVPTLYQGMFDEDPIEEVLIDLRDCGSQAVPGYMNPEGIVVYHSAANQAFKVTLDGDGNKWRAAA